MYTEVTRQRLAASSSLICVRTGWKSLHFQSPPLPSGCFPTMRSERLTLRGRPANTRKGINISFSRSEPPSPAFTGPVSPRREINCDHRGPGVLRACPFYSRDEFILPQKCVYFLFIKRRWKEIFPLGRKQSQVQGERKGGISVGRERLENSGSFCQIVFSIRVKKTLKGILPASSQFG